MEHKHNWRMFFIGNFGSDRFGDKGAVCSHYNCVEELTAEEVNRRLNATEALTAENADAHRWGDYKGEELREYARILSGG